jgi:hypothetical protein
MMTAYLLRNQNRPAITGRIVRGLLAAAVRHAAVSAPVVAERPVPDPVGLFADDEMPDLPDILAAAEQFFRATEQSRVADRAKRASRKLLDRLPAGRFGMWEITRVANAREVADLDAIRAIFKTHGLGDVPMKACAPSLKVGIATDAAVPDYVTAEQILNAGAR